MVLDLLVADEDADDDERRPDALAERAAAPAATVAMVAPDQRHQIEDRHQHRQGQGVRHARPPYSVTYATIPAITLISRLPVT